MTDRRDTHEAREVMERAIRRLGVLEHLFLGLAAVTALLAGALFAWLLRQAFGAPFRLTWAITSLLLFVVPGAFSWWQVRRQDRLLAERRRRADDPTPNSSSHD